MLELPPATHASWAQLTRTEALTQHWNSSKPRKKMNSGRESTQPKQRILVLLGRLTPRTQTHRHKELRRRMPRRRTPGFLYFQLSSTNRRATQRFIASTLEQLLPAALMRTYARVPPATRHASIVSHSLIRMNRSSPNWPRAMLSAFCN